MKLTQRNYFSRKASMEFMSVSQFKSFQKCPAATLAEIKGKYKREKSTALLVGSYVDSYFEGTLPKFIKENPEIFKKNGTLKAEYEQAEAIIHASPQSFDPDIHEVMRAYPLVTLTRMAEIAATYIN